MRPVFYYDFGSPYAYLAAERISALFDEQPEWQPILLGGLFQIHDRGSWAETDKRAEGIAECERRAAEYGLPEIRWPDPWPGNMLGAMRAATFAKQIGKTVAFSQAAFRQAFAAGRDLGRARQRADRRGCLRDAPEGGRGRRSACSRSRTNCARRPSRPPRAE